MKFIISLLLLLFVQISYATTYYISPSGNDVSGTGSIGNPWKSLYKATSVVKTAGDIIHVSAGNYLETVRCNLSVGVSIEGEGADVSIIQSTLNAQFVAIIIATSPEGTNGNQHISNIRLDGNKRTTSWAIEIRGRSNFSIHDCIIQDFEESGVHFGGRADNETEPPAIYATGNSFYNNTVINCAKYDGYGRGCLLIGGQKGMLIYNNTISQTGRAKGTNGWPIKACNNGFLKGCKIYNNKITKQAYDGMTWDFAIELFNESGLEVYNNRIIGSLDLNHQTKGDYLYSVYVHDNIMGPDSLQSKVETGITLEYETENAIIENNQLQNLAIPIYFTPRDGSLIADVLIKNNVCENIGVDNESRRGYAINFSSDGTGNHIITNFFVIGNKFIARAKNSPYYGIEITGVGPFTNIKIQNNTISNFEVACIAANPAFVIDTLIIENNTLFSNGNNNKPFFVRGMPGNYIFKNNASSGSGPGFNLKQQVLRPLYHEVRNISIPELIALFAFFIALWFSSKESIYVFPLGLIYTVIYALLYLEKELPGNAATNFICAALCIYGWKIWAKRDRRKHRVLRITSSSGKEWMMQVILFILSFAVVFFIMTKYKNIFSPDSIPIADALATAAVFTASWAMVTKKVESWYWWMAAALALTISSFFLKHYMFYSFCGFMLLAISAWGLYQWKKRRVSRRRHQQSQT